MHKRTKMPQNFFSRMYQRSTDCFSTATLKVRFFFGTTCFVLYCFVFLCCCVLYCTIICWSLLSWFCLSYQARSSTTTSSTYTVLLLFFFILYYNMLGWSFLFLGQPVLYYIVLWCGCVSPLRLGPPQHLQLIQLYYCSVLYCTIIYWVGASIFLGTTCIVLYCCVV